LSWTFPDDITEPEGLLSGDSLPDVSEILTEFDNTSGPPVTVLPGRFDDLTLDSDSPPVQDRSKAPGNLQDEIDISDISPIHLSWFSSPDALEGKSEVILSPRYGSGMGGSLDSIREMEEASDSAPNLIWIPRHIAALDPASVTHVRAKVGAAVDKLNRSKQLRTVRVKSLGQFRGLGSCPTLTRGTRVPSSMSRTSPIATRSRGPVPSLPNVQQTTLEFRKRKVGCSVDATSGEE
jgi:hypothetical protein